MEQLFKIVLTGTLEALPECESLTEAQCQEWLNEHQEIFEVENEYGDLAKYITIAL